MDTTNQHLDQDGAADLCITLPASSENVGLLRHIVGALGDAYDVSRAKMEDVLLALSEAATNAAVHAYAGSPGPVTVAARVDGDRMAIRVRDQGRGMTPRVQSTGLGVGLALIACVAESLELRERSEGGTDVSMVFHLADDPASVSPIGA